MSGISFVDQAETSSPFLPGRSNTTLCEDIYLQQTTMNGKEEEDHKVQNVKVNPKPHFSVC